MARNKLSDVNSASIRDAVALGCETMGMVFNADDRDTPFAYANLRPAAEFRFLGFDDTQVPGRSLSALLSAEQSLGIHVDEGAVDKHSRALFASHGGPIALPLRRDKSGGRIAAFFPVDFAHTLNGLYWLLAQRGSAQAHELAEASIGAVLQLWDPKLGWNRQRLETELGLRYIDGYPDAPFIAGPAMAIGPLIRYHRATNSTSALELATRLKDKAVGEFFIEAGDFDVVRLGTHVHNVVYTMASLAEFAVATRDATVTARVRAFYDNGLKQISNAFGWAPEFAGLTAAPGRLPQSANPDQGEAGNTAKILETALQLGKLGYPNYYDDAERILRGHLLPSQLRDVSFITNPDNPDGKDSNRKVAERVRGAWGYPAPYGHAAIGTRYLFTTLDTVGTVVSALSEANHASAQFDGQTHLINLLFDVQSPDIDVQSPYGRGTLQLTLKHPGNVLVRMPPWVDPSGITINGSAAASRPIDGYLHVAAPAAGVINVQFPLTPRQVDLTFRNRTIRTRLTGDQVTQMENFGADLTYFDSFS